MPTGALLLLLRFGPTEGRVTDTANTFTVLRGFSGHESRLRGFSNNEATLRGVEGNEVSLRGDP